VHSGRCCLLMACMRGFAAGAFCWVFRAAPYSSGSKATSTRVPVVSPRWGLCVRSTEEPRAVALTKLGVGSSLQLLRCEMPPTAYFRKGLYPPTPPLIKRSQIFAVAVMICSGELRLHLGTVGLWWEGGLTPRSRFYPLQWGRGSARPGAQGRRGLAIRAGKGLLRCRPFARGRGRKRSGLGKARPSA